jgi:hypothetical protein
VSPLSINWPNADLVVDADDLILRCAGYVLAEKLDHAIT